jgi:PAS domain S-box-containing protein
MSPRGKGLLSLSSRWIAVLVVVLAWLGLTAAAVARVGTVACAEISGVALAALVVTAVITRWAERRRWADPVERLALEVAKLVKDPHNSTELSYVPELHDLLRPLREIKNGWRPLSDAQPWTSQSSFGSGEWSTPVVESLTRSGMYVSLPCDSFDGKLSGDFSTTDMVSRLEPRSFRWVESSPAEQDFLGWPLPRLREMSFLEIVHPDDYPRAREQLQTALAKGEIHGLILRVKTARGKQKAIEMNVSARYGPDMAITHLRCHVTDVTAKIRADRELKLRTRELTQVNEQLRQINRELEELKDQYRDLYQNAPAMYFSLDERGRILDCNDTLLQALGYRREEVVGGSYERLLPVERRPQFAERYAELIRRRLIEAESQWAKSNGEVIDIWVSGTAVIARDGSFLQLRSVAQDITARHRLEAELKDKNTRLAQTNEELSRKNKEMDEFAYVVSHDLQEPLRTLIAFSDFLMRDCGDRLDANGQEYVRYLVDASRRLRSLIQGLLSLSRAGRVTGEFSKVNLDDVIAVVKADLAELIRSKGAEMRTHVPLPVLWGDRDRIGQLMANLVSNGLKYNHSHPPVVEVGVVGDDLDPWVTLYVRDNGIGIEPQFHAKIFQLFRRLHTSEEYEGTGAGLSICNKIVQAHDGRIWVESEPNRGSTFYIRLRRSAPEDSLSRAQVIHAS